MSVIIDVGHEAFIYLLVVRICLYSFVADTGIIINMSLIPDIGRSWVKMYFKPTLRLKPSETSHEKQLVSNQPIQTS